MITFTIDDLPSTFARILEVDDRQVREEIIACVHSVWEQASYNPHVLSNIGLDAWASHYAMYCDRDELLVYLRQLRMEMLKNASIYEQYHAEVDPEEAFEDFIEGNSIQEDVYTLFVEENDPDEISDIAADNACELFRRLYGISMTESQQLDTLDFIRDLVDQEFQNFRYYEEEPIMTANYKNNTNKSHFIETVQLALSDQAVLDELKNNYYASVAANSLVLTKEGQLEFANEWIDTVLNNLPNAKEVPITDIASSTVWLVNSVIGPMAEEIKKAEPEETQESQESETFEPEKADPEETQEPEKAPKKINVFVTLGNKTKKAFKRAIAAIRKVLTTIGNAIKNAAIKTGRKACDVANFIYSHCFLKEAINMLESLLISTAMGQVIVRIMYALHVTGFGSAFFIILAAGCAITCMLEVFVSWLNEEVLYTMSSKHLYHKRSCGAEEPKKECSFDKKAAMKAIWESV